jgi:tripeptidyl-peptidase I
MRVPTGFLALGLLSAVLAVPSPHLVEHVIHERRARDPMDWEVTRRPNTNMTIPLRIGLQQQNIDAIEEMLMAVSHPDSSTYGQHWSAEQVVETFSPTDDTVRSVLGWLSDFGFSSDKVKMSGNRGWIQVHATVAEVEQLLRTEYHVYTHIETGEEQIGMIFEFSCDICIIKEYLLIGCKTYSIPAHLQSHVDLIRPTVHFNHRPSPSYALDKRAGGLGAAEGVGPKMSSKKPTSHASLDTCDTMITLDCLRALYDIDYTPVYTDKNTFGIGV